NRGVERVPARFQNAPGRLRRLRFHGRDRGLTPANDRTHRLDSWNLTILRDCRRHNSQAKGHHADAWPCQRNSHRSLTLKSVLVVGTLDPRLKKSTITPFRKPPECRRPTRSLSPLSAHPSLLEFRRLHPTRTIAPAPWFRWAQVPECLPPPTHPIRKTCGPTPARDFPATRRPGCRLPPRGPGSFPLL